MTFELELRYKLDPSNVEKEDFKSFGDDLNHFIAEHQCIFRDSYYKENDKIVIVMTYCSNCGAKLKPNMKFFNI